MSVNDKNPFENLPVSTDPVGTVNTLIKVLRKQQSDEPKAKFSGTYENAFTLKVDEKERISKAVDQLATSLQSYPQPIQMNTASGGCMSYSYDAKTRILTIHGIQTRTFRNVNLSEILGYCDQVRFQQSYWRS